MLGFAAEQIKNIDTDVYKRQPYAFGNLCAQRSTITWEISVLLFLNKKKKSLSCLLYTSVVAKDSSEAVAKAKELVLYLPSNNLNTAPESFEEEPAD